MTTHSQSVRKFLPSHTAIWRQYPKGDPPIWVLPHMVLKCLHARSSPSQPWPEVNHVVQTTRAQFCDLEIPIFLHTPLPSEVPRQRATRPRNFPCAKEKQQPPKNTTHTHIRVENWRKSAKQVPPPRERTETEATRERERVCCVRQQKCCIARVARNKWSVSWLIVLKFESRAKASRAGAPAERSRSLRARERAARLWALRACRATPAVSRPVEGPRRPVGTWQVFKLIAS